MAASRSSSPRFPSALSVSLRHFAPGALCGNRLPSFLNRKVRRVSVFSEREGGLPAAFSEEAGRQASVLFRSEEGSDDGRLSSSWFSSPDSLDKGTEVSCRSWEEAFFQS